MRLTLQSPSDLSQALGRRVKVRRLERNIPQSVLAERAGVSLPSLKRLENTGKGSVDLLVRLALNLGAGEEVEALFAQTMPKKIEDVIEPVKRQRASSPATGADKK